MVPHPLLMQILGGAHNQKGEKVPDGRFREDLWPARHVRVSGCPNELEAVLECHVHEDAASKEDSGPSQPL